MEFSERGRAAAYQSRIDLWCAAQCMQNASSVGYTSRMDTITVRNVPPALHEALKEKARRTGCSLQEIALKALEEKVERLTPDEWLHLARENARQYGVRMEPEDIVRAVREERGDPYP